MSELPSVPDFLGKARRIETVSDLLQSAQEQLQVLEAQRIVNSHKLDEQIPGGDGITYSERFKALNEGVKALLAKNKDIGEELVAEAVRRRKVTERAIEKAHAKQFDDAAAE